MPRVILTKTNREYQRYLDWLRGEMKRQKMNQTQLGQILGHDQVGISNRLNGVVEWSLPDVLETLEIFGAKLDDIIG